MNNRRIRERVIPVLLGATILATSGCSRASTPPAPDMAGGVYIRAGYEYIHWKEGLDVMIWHDAIQSSSCESTGSTSEDKHIVRCQAIGPANKGFDWQLDTEDGITGAFTLNSKSYDLSDGNVFIVSTARELVDIQQLQRDLSGVYPNGESITEFGLKDPDIDKFIQSVSQD